MSSRRPLSGKTALLLLSGTKVDFVVHGLVITVRFGSSLDQNPVLPAVFLELPTLS